MNKNKGNVKLLKKYDFDVYSIGGRIRNNTVFLLSKPNLQRCLTTRGDFRNLQ